MAEYVWYCIYCKDSVKGNMKSLVYEAAEEHNKKHKGSAPVQLSEIEKVKD